MATVAVGFPLNAKNKALVEAIIGRDDIAAPLFELYFDAAVEAADLFLNNPFINRRTGVDLPIPALVKQGVGELIKHYATIADREAGIKSVSNLNVSVTFADTNEAFEQDVCVRFFQPYRINPGL